ncbi:MAG: hypothetical protein RJB31_1367 [Bacteroidota bacterium]
MKASYGQAIDSMINVYADQFPKEKIHVHFDKTIYNKEETIWYKIYILDDQGLTQLSKNVYMEWFDQAGKLIRQHVAPLFQSSAKGSFELPADYTGSVIRMKVYTRWSLNDDPAFGFERDIIINNNETIVKPSKAENNTIVNVFPEGGELITGLNSLVAFKATDKFGKPVKIKGLLVNQLGKTLDTIKVRHDGMGSFRLMPKAGESYSLKWIDPAGNTGIIGIPVNKKEGITLSLSTSNEFATVKVERTASIPENHKRLNLLVHMNQIVLFKVKLNTADKQLLSANIPIEGLNTGILQFSLFSEDWLPLAERIVFVNNREHEFGAKLIPQLVTLTKKGKNVFDIYVTDTTVTNMSVAVTDASLESTQANHTIYSDLLLSSELKGKIHNPGYYLSSDADSVTANLDLVMLTNGWRKFNWDKIKASIGPEIKYPVETDLIRVSGKVYGLKNVSANDLMLNLVIQNKDSSKNFIFQPVTKEGLFQGQNMYIFDTARIFYNFNQNQKLNEITQVQFDNGLLKASGKQLELKDENMLNLWNDSVSLAKMNAFLQLQEDWKKRSSYKTLQEVIIKAKVKSNAQALDERYSSGLFAGGDAQVFDFLNDPAALGGIDIISYLQGRVAGLMINRSGASTTMSWRGATPDLYLDQMQVGADFIQSINVQDIAMVKVFRPPFFGSMGGGSGGAIAIYTKKGGDFRSDNTKSNKSMQSTLLVGYTRFKEFFNPQYENPAENNETDIRTTLYWNPYVITNKKSPRFKVQFFNNDISKKLQIVLEGVNADGKMTRVVKLLE